MKLSDLRFEFPPGLVATEPQRPSRILLSYQGKPREISKAGLWNAFSPGDVLVLNDTKVIPRRVFTPFHDEELEILFVREEGENIWEVLFPARKLKKEKNFSLPGDIEAKLVQGGRPQKIRVSRQLSTQYFETHGEPPLPPYIQQARNSRHTSKSDVDWYQTVWAENPGSVAAPTASLHFDHADLAVLEARGVILQKVTLHVGLGTFLPMETENLKDHKLHSEEVIIPVSSWQAIQAAQERGARVWAMGTTVARTLESMALDRFPLNGSVYSGETDLFIQEGFDFQVVDRLLTNFHLPESSLLALVATFAGLETTLAGYRWAVNRGFRLFSYGDLTVWIP